MSPLIRVCEARGLPYITIHTGQHYSYEMDRLLYEQLGVREPEHNLAIKSRSPMHQGEHTGKMLIEIERVLLEERPDVVLIQGDTNTVLAAAIAVSKLKTHPVNVPIRLGHVEAGLRSFDRAMTEEINRLHADHMADYAFAPSETAKEHLLRERIGEDHIFVTGNTIVDAVEHHLPQAMQSDMAARLELEPKKYIVATAHRQENVDDQKRFQDIIAGLLAVAKETGFQIVYPMHPRTKKIVEERSVVIPSDIVVIEPVGFIESLALTRQAALIITDSGGMQEEASILHVPCLTVRDSTERPETVAAGYNCVVGTAPEAIASGARHMLRKTYDWQPLYGDGRAAEKIMDIITAEHPNV